MIGPWKVKGLKQPFSKRLSTAAKEDILSQLPDPLICNILSHLPTKEAVKTSVLSTRWRNLWLYVLNLNLESKDFPDINTFVSFGDWFVDSVRASHIHKVKLTIDENIQGVDGSSYLKSWIDNAVKHKIKHLDVRCPPEYCYEMPLSLYVCETLVSLKLFQVNVVDAEFVSLPSLKSLYLEYNWYPNETTCERLVSSCPVLEELKIDVAWNYTKVLRVQSRSLKRFSLVRVSSFRFGSVLGVVVDAPQLRSLRINDHVSESFRVNNLESNVKLDISLLFGLKCCNEPSFSSRKNSIDDFLKGISRVREMIICPRTFKVINEYAKLESLPQFCYMSRLCVTLCVSNLEWLPIFLESCPNLKSLILDWNGNSKKMHIEEMSEISFPSVPKCMVSSLEFVDIKSNIFGYGVEMKVLRYFLENSKSLKKLSLRLHYHAIQDDFVRKLHKIPRLSVTCKVFVLGLEITSENLSFLV